jgi:hypothetical protein
MWLLPSAGVHVFDMFCSVPISGTSLYSCACVLVLCDMCVHDRQRLNGTCLCVYVRVTCSHRFARSQSVHICAHACGGLLAPCGTACVLIWAVLSVRPIWGREAVAAGQIDR